jgi:hypothetical protein
VADGTEPDPRDAIHEAIQANAQRGKDAILTGWALVAEWIDHDGDRWLSQANCVSTAHWTARGMHHEVLYGKWPDPDDDD